MLGSRERLNPLRKIMMTLKQLSKKKVLSLELLLLKRQKKRTPQLPILVKKKQLTAKKIKSFKIRVMASGSSKLRAYQDLFHFYFSS